MALFERESTGRIREALRRPQPVMHVITGPRQVGKTTAARQIAETWGGPVQQASADGVLPPSAQWITHHWEAARRRTGERPLLVLDEIQKVDGWSEVVKRLWDEDARSRTPLGVLLLGSSSLLVGHGLSESLAGRFFLHRMTHWTYPEMARAFGYTMEDWLYFGGYPAAAAFRADEPAWKAYVRDSLIETVISRDVLQLQTVNKPALLRNLFLLSAAYPAQILSYNKMLGQLTDAGNTTTLAHYVSLLESAYLLSGLELYKLGLRPKRGSSPKLVVWNNALVNALDIRGFREVIGDHARWGRLVENAVGAHLVNALQGLPYELYYWRRGDSEVDYVLHTPARTWAIEVKSTRPRGTGGLEEFVKLHPRATPIILGPTGMSLERFFSSTPPELLE